MAAWEVPAGGVSPGLASRGRAEAAGTAVWPAAGDVWIVGVEDTTSPPKRISDTASKSNSWVPVGVWKRMTREVPPS
jgi:hypothetical protein